ncbi:MAG TPA: hypothetical protein VFO00_05595 [Vitreimonas sp.]|nr:hypothetical protein [Vitreimonas sp.]
MTKLDLVLARIKELPPERQEMIAVEIEFMLDHDLGDGLLTSEQEAELDRRLADPNKKYVSHEDVAAFFEKKYGR